MTAINLPSPANFRAVRFGIIGRTTVFESALSGVEQVLERTGARWFGEFAVPPLDEDDVAAWQAFLVQLNGRAGTFWGFDPGRTSPRGVATGTPLVDGASQTGTTLATKGWTPDTTGILKAGDYIGVASRFYQVVADANADSSGDASLSIRPKLRESPADEAPITTSNPKVEMRLADDVVSWDVDLALEFGISFAAIEVL